MDQLPFEANCRPTDLLVLPLELVQFECAGHRDGGGGSQWVRTLSAASIANLGMGGIGGRHRNLPEVELSLAQEDVRVEVIEAPHLRAVKKGGRGSYLQQTPKMIIQ